MIAAKVTIPRRERRGREYDEYKRLLQ
jgi:hypothetical protein